MGGIYNNPIGDVWGTQLDKEQRVRRHIEHRDEEALRTRQAIEAAYAAAAFQAQQQTAAIQASRAQEAG